MRRMVMFLVVGLVVAACGGGEGTSPDGLGSSEPADAGVVDDVEVERVDAVYEVISASAYVGEVVDLVDFDGYSAVSSGGPVLQSEDLTTHGYIHLLTRVVDGSREDLILLTRTGADDVPEVVADALVLVGDTRSVRFGIGCSGRAPAAVIDAESDSLLRAWLPTGPDFVLVEVDPGQISTVEREEICDVRREDAGIPSAMTARPLVFAGVGRDALLDIWVYDVLAGVATNLTGSPGHESAPALSPDGTRVVFHAVADGDLAGGNWDLYVMNVDGSGLVRLTEEPSGEFFPDWSPDGTEIVFERDAESGGRDLWVVSADGSDQRQLTDWPGEESGAAWSPDGTLIAFSSDRDAAEGTCQGMGSADCNVEVYVMGVDGAGLVRLTTAPGVDGFPEWSPDGTRLAFHSNRVNPPWNFDIFIMNVDGSAQTRITSDPDDLAEFAWSQGHPAWSPDGRSIVFTSDQAMYLEEDPGTMIGAQLFWCDPDDCRPEHVQNTPSDLMFPDW